MGKKVANVISNTESDNDNESLYSSIIDDKDILDCLLSLSCISSNRKQKKRHAKCRKTDNRKTLPKKKARTLLTQYKQNHCHHNDTAEQCYLNLSEDMVEDNPLDLENTKERQDEDDNLLQSTVKHLTW